MAGTGSLYHKTQPTSTNYLYPNYFNFRLMKLPSTNFTLQSANVPGVSLGRLDQPNPAHGAPLQGDRMFFGDFAFSFLILEDMSNYIEIWEWMAQITNHDKQFPYAGLRDQQAGAGNGLYSDATLFIMNSAKKPIKQIQFTQMFPIQLSDLMFDTQADGSQYVKAQCTFSFKDYRIE